MVRSPGAQARGLSSDGKDDIRYGTVWWGRNRHPNEKKKKKKRARLSKLSHAERKNPRRPQPHERHVVRLLPICWTNSSSAVNAIVKTSFSPFCPACTPEEGRSRSSCDAQVVVNARNLLELISFLSLNLLICLLSDRHGPSSRAHQLVHSSCPCANQHISLPRCLLKVL